MSLLNEINLKANDKVQLNAIITEGEALVAEVEQFLKENKITFNLKEAIGRSFSAPGEQPVADPGSMDDIMAGMNQESSKMEMIKKKLMMMAQKLHSVRDSAQRAALFKKITMYANKAGIDPEEIFAA